MRLKIVTKKRVPIETKIGNKILLGTNFWLTSKRVKPQSSSARKRYTFSLRANDNKKYRFYSTQASPGCVHIHFEEAK